MDLKKIERFIFFSLVLFLPTQLSYHFWPDYAFIFGIRIDYLAPTIYLTDILVAGLLFVWFLRKGIPSPSKWFYVIITFAFINTLFSTSIYPTLFKWIKIFEIYLFSSYISHNTSLVKTKTFRNTLSISLLIVSILAISQFFIGRTVGVPFNFLGERTFNIETPGIALQSIFGVNFMRAYSTFPHPNSLSGFLVIAILFLLLTKKKDLLVKASLILSSISFMLTFSLSSLIGVASLLLRKYFKFIICLAIVFSVAITFISPALFTRPEIIERVEQAHIAREIFISHPLIGSGLNTFVLFNRGLQPVHNIYLLVLSETGIIGFVFLSMLLYNSFKKRNYLFLLLVVVIGTFDHYFLTLQQNLLTLAFVFGTVFAKRKKLQLH